jgi:phosphate transport system substrate-binding protein
MVKKITICTVVLLAAAGMLFASGSKEGQSGSAETPAAKKTVDELLGAGATFPFPFYSKMFDAYYSTTGVKVNYQAIGSGGGIRQLLSKTVDFGGTDAFMSDEDLANAEGAILHVPTCMGAVSITYNLEGAPSLNFTSEIIAGIFLGEIVKWDDPRIQKVNSGVSLPDQEIVVAHRSDGSGTTFIFSDYLAKVSPEWKSRVGRGKSLNWPVGLGGKGNPGVAGIVKQTPGAIGYVELIYAIQNNMPVGNVENKSGSFIKPSIESVSKAANVNLPADTRVSITNTEASDGYPISGFTWLIFYKEQNYGDRSLDRAKELLRLIWFAEHEGQQYAEPLHYAPLPDSAVKKAEVIIDSVTYNGKSVDFK